MRDRVSNRTPPSTARGGLRLGGAARPTYRGAMKAMLAGFLAATAAAAAPAWRSADRTAGVGADGVMRWTDDGTEVALFGVNYYTPFQWNYRDVAALGLDHERVIERDVQHLARLGLDAIRLHCFDREISDAQGNLLENDHLRLLDALIARAKDRGIYTVLTPIAWWAVPGDSPGFSTRFPMPQMTTDPGALAPQTRYLAQFVRHVNPRTGLAYKDDPAVVAFELINEPHYPEGTTDAQVTAYIDALAGAVRATGCRKPIFYNGWGGRLAAVAASRADGSSFGWYPTGLVAGHAWRRNALPLVDRYGGSDWTPPMESPVLAGKAKIVYEFDAADIGGSYMYPAMARAFRAGGAQIATQFQYDPLPVAPFNAGWQTHYLNLSFAPGKAVSFAVAAEAFRRLPRLRTWPPHPAGDRFDGFRVSFAEDLSEFADERTFLHSNSTTSPPPAPASLRRIAGCGSSPLVKTDGTGAFFLDRLGDGLWRLEVHPDAVWLEDPFGPDRIGREVSRVLWRTRDMEIRLPDLGGAFTIEPLDPGNAHRAAATDGRVAVRPGVYAVRRAGCRTALPDRAELPAAIGLREFVAPGPVSLPPAARANLPAEWVAGRPLPLRVTLAADTDPASVALRIGTDDSAPPLPMTRDGVYGWSVLVPADRMRPGSPGIRIEASIGGAPVRFPTNGCWNLRVVDAAAPVSIFDAARDRVRVHGQTPNRVRTVPGMGPGAKAIRIEVDRFGPPPSSISFRHEAGDFLDPRRGDLTGRTTVVVRARSAAPATTRIEMGLIESDGTAWGTEVPLTPGWTERRIPLTSLRFFGHWPGAPAGRGTAGDRPDPRALAAVSVCFGAWLAPGRHDEPHGVEIESISIE